MNEATQRVEAMDLLLRASELLDRYADVTDGADGQPQANVAMSLKSDIDAFLRSPASVGWSVPETPVEPLDPKVGHYWRRPNGVLCQWTGTAWVASPSSPSEICICAAVQTNEGLVIIGHRHADAMRAASMAFCTVKRGEGAQGFITSTGRYVDRLEGRALQEAAGVGSVSPGGYSGNLLYSEDLY